MNKMSINQNEAETKRNIIFQRNPKKKVSYWDLGEKANSRIMFLNLAK